MSILNVTKAALLGSALYIPLSFVAAQAADLIIYPEPVAEQPVQFVMPAVSGPNGKFELDLGGLTDPSSVIFRGGASFSLPVGERFGLQGDLAVGSFADEWVGGGALHAFARDPSSYLLGVTAGVVVADGATLAAIGPEAELYLDRLSIETWAGWAKVDYDSLPDDDGAFGIFDFAYYPTDNWRLSIGASSILGLQSARFATEYQFGDFGMPLSGIAEARYYDTGAWSAKIGIKGYFGGDPDKSLIDRHRQDDPPNRALDLFGAAGQLLVDQPVADDEPEEPPIECPDPEVPVPDGEGGWVCEFPERGPA